MDLPGEKFPEESVPSEGGTCAGRGAQLAAFRPAGQHSPPRRSVRSSHGAVHGASLLQAGHAVWRAKAGVPLADCSRQRFRCQESVTQGTGQTFRAGSNCVSSSQDPSGILVRLDQADPSGILVHLDQDLRSNTDIVQHRQQQHHENPPWTRLDSEALSGWHRS